MTIRLAQCQQRRADLEIRILDCLGWCGRSTRHLSGVSRILTAMGLLQTVFWCLVSAPIVLYASLLFVFGIPIFKSKRWDVAFQRSAVAELYRRGLQHDLLTIDEMFRAESILGTTNLIDVDDEIDVGDLAGLNALLERKASADELLKIRRAFLVGALRRQRAAAWRIRRLRNLPRVWWAVRIVSDMEVGIRGMLWISVRHMPMVKRLFDGPGQYCVVAGVMIGVIHWVVQSASRSAASMSDIVGVVITWTSILAVLWMVASVIRAVSIAVRGQRRRLDRAGMVGFIFSVAMVSGVLTLYVTGAFGWLVRSLGEISRSISASGGVPIRISAVLFAGLAIWMAWRVGRTASFKHLRLSCRIDAIVGALMILAVAILSMQMALGDFDVPGIEFVFWMLGSTVIALVLVGRSAAVLEWIRRRRFLIRAGIRIPCRGFGIRTGVGVLMINVGVWLSVVAIDRVSYSDESALQVAAFIIVGATMLGFLLSAAWCVAGWLYVRRVDKLYEKHRIVVISELSGSGFSGSLHASR
ncbi:hypothetical protein [Rhodococcus sp. BS-15]|uniref:hypothetical protein n=1 Tax=Rhodococcus sp. BS-15 TaxID=1304954 RepID=UPI001650FDD6|nr:hypothetical protein [Rhodococcus sp. BS-15]